MPSGAKKRKAAAAKKKKETPSGSGATDSFNGMDNLKGQESDGGASQDLLESGGLTRSFTEEGGNGDRSLVRKIDTEKDIAEEVVVVEAVKEEEDQDSVETSSKLKYDNGLESSNLGVEVVKSAQGSSDGSSSSSSDEETIDIEKTAVVLDPVKLEEVYDVVENDVDPQVPEFFAEEVVENDVDSQASYFVAEEVVENAVGAQVPEFAAEEVVENTVDSQVPEFAAEEMQENTVDSQVADFEAEEVVENVVDSHMPDFVAEVVAENAASLSLPDLVADVVENAVDSPMPDFVVKEVVYVSGATPVEEHYEDLDKPVLSEANYEINTNTDDALPAHPLPIESHGESSKIPMAQAPLSVHRTSWKGCCGLFEVFAGSR